MIPAELNGIKPLEAMSYTPLPTGTNASFQFDILKECISSFEKTLDTEHEVGLMLTNFGQSVLMVVSEISFKNPVLMVFKGNVNEQMCTLVQHVNQLSFLLTSVPKPNDRPKQKIGFVTE